MAYTQIQLDALDEAIAGGALTVKYADKEVTYRSLNDMLRTRNLMATELGIKKPDSGRKFAEFHSGLKGPASNSNSGTQFFD